jgi:two-component system cell cycle sensor histidine kinase/response regulator CckA
LRHSRHDHYRLSISDITSRKQAEAELRESNHRLQSALAELQTAQQRIVQQERLAVVGQLAAGIAHDFNNILAAMLGNAELLELSPDLSAASRADVGTIIAGGQRATRLIRQLLDFSRKSIRQPQPLDLVELLNELVRFWQRIIPEHIQLSLSIEPGAYQIEADPTQLHQLLTNLAINARDAMPAGGILHIRLATVALEHDVECMGCLQAFAGRWFRLQVVDTGEGIVPANLSRIFEPFFTTKANGTGSGLGLAQVLGIVEQHGGHIRVDSQPGCGTTFAIFLPPAPATQRAAGFQKGAVSRQGLGQTVLLVEDDATVLTINQKMLELLGYRPLTARNGQQALSLYQAHQRQIDLVLSDMVMPDMSGIELLEKLKLHDPDIRCIIISGYQLGEESGPLVSPNIAGWLQKPVSLRRLSEVIAQVLKAPDNERTA